MLFCKFIFLFSFPYIFSIVPWGGVRGGFEVLTWYRRSVGAPVDEKEISVCFYPSQTHVLSFSSFCLWQRVFYASSAANMAQTAEENRAELDNYDMKVYKASRQMADAMMGELRALQIPFFSIKQSLVFDSAGKEGAGLGVGSLHSTGDSRGQRGLGSDELAVLRRRMLELLQDLCRE
jgi:hypothetical protein